MLKENPHSLNIEEIVGKTGYDRASLPHYMKALLDLGYVDLKEIEKMKIYYPAQTDSSSSRPHVYVKGYADRRISIQQTYYVLTHRSLSEHTNDNYTMS